MKIYISGGISKVPNYRERFRDAEEALILFGHTALNPAKTGDAMPSSTDYSGYMRMCISMIEQADMIVLLPEWEKSEGATFEMQYARLVKNIPVIEFTDFITHERRFR